MSIVNNLKKSILTYLELQSIKSFDTTYIDNNDTKTNLAIIKIRDEHIKYVQSISSPKMALSFELAEVIYRHCTIYKPKRVLDLGSGFSSYILRLYKKNDSNIEVFSVDDNSEWLKKTESYLEEHTLSTHNLFSLSTFINLQLKNSFDLILLDLNFVEVRKDYLHFSIDLLGENGMLIFDDAHKIEFLREIKKVVKDYPGQLCSIKKNTIDSFGRFSLVYKNDI